LTQHALIQANQQNSPEFLKINPRGEVPCLVIDDNRILNDSSSILVWLAGNCGDDGTQSSAPSSYWSADLFEQAQIVNWVSSMFSSTIMCLAKTIWLSNAFEDQTLMTS